MATDRVLIVDDDRVIQELLRVNLELEGYQVEIASDGEEALRRFEAFRPELVLLDIMMPRLDGWQVARRLKEREAARAVPVVVVSARAQDADMQRGSEIGVAAYVTKPFDPIVLMDVVRRLLADARGPSGPGPGHAER
ncbi:MAG TPA: response regulator [Actinomycetes bacterium]|nr:response regulator [Actinomycetes bacterium]